jgi:hypothetical protein
LTSGQLRSTSDDAVVNTLAADIFVDSLDSRGTTSLLLMDLVQSRLLGATESKNHFEVLVGRYKDVMKVKEL